MASVVFPTPDDQQFNDEDWLVDARLRDLADALIEKHPELAHLFDMHVEYRWKRTGGTSQGQLTMGKCVKVSGNLKAAWPGADFLIWLAADHCHNLETTDYQVRAYLFHELLHTGVNEKGKPMLRPHDWQGFDSELREFGLYDQYLQAAGAAFQQLALAAD